MIFPWLNFILFPHKAPVTWILTMLNILIYIITMNLRQMAEADLNPFYRDSFFLNTQGAIYAKYIQQHPSAYSTLTQEKARQALTGDRPSLQTLASYAFRDPFFLESVEKLRPQGDTVAIQFWRHKIHKLKQLQQSHPDHELAFFSSAPHWTQALTYQFTHANWTHLLSNILFLVLLGCYLEPLIGSAAFLLAYLTCGIMGAWAYQIIVGPSAIPMIGASGSISGLFGLMGALLGKKPVRFVYFILPQDKFWGFVYLPAWIILIHRFILDLTGYLSTVEEMGSGTAFSTHLGGMLVGVLLAVFIFRRSKSTA